MVETRKQQREQREQHVRSFKRTMPTCSTPLLQPPPTINYSPPTSNHQTRCDTPFPPAGAVENSKNSSSAAATAADKEVEILMMKSIKQHENIQDATLFLPIPTNFES